MAVVSISRIQLRRGKKNQGTGLPQLASGELGWAIDTQELYIGNGSVSEGAPYVGNTRLLSESDDLFALATNYTYTSAVGNVQTGSSPSLPVIRSLQDRLDDRVSLRAFGATGDNTDHAVLLQQAIDQLYLNTNSDTNIAARVELIIEPGEYTLSNTVYLPPYITLRGAGSKKTIFNTTLNTIAFQTVNSTSTVGNYDLELTSSSNQARNISFKGLTINTQGASALNLVSCKDSTFEDLVLRGTWEFGETVSKSNTAIDMSIPDGLGTTSNNNFSKVKIYNYAYAATSDDDISDNTFDDCAFDKLWSGVVLGEDTLINTPGQLTGPRNNVVRNSIFGEEHGIVEIGFKALAGSGNLSESNKYYDVGNDQGTLANNTYPIIEFSRNAGTSHNDWFLRSTELGYNQNFINNVPYTTEIEGSQITQLNTSHTLTVGELGQFEKLFKLPAASNKRGYVVDYFYRSSFVDAARSGAISIIVDPVNDNVSFSDEYDYAGDPTYSDNIELNAILFDENANGEVDTVAIMMLNSTINDTAEFTYTVRYKT